MFLRLLLWLPALAWMGVIFYWSSQPVLPIDGQPNSGLLHRTAHLIAYAILALLLALGSGTSQRGLRAAFLLAVLYGLTDEVHQSFVPGRHGRVQEVVTDAAAAAAILALFVLLRSTAHRVLRNLTKTVHP
ncbi:MAG: VanZ family protein [Chloroflexi bacterium]|nr:VanZ family protein [Chloroflexota bacterium]